MKSIQQRSQDAGVFTLNPNLTGLIRYEVPIDANSATDQVTTLQALIDQAQFNGTIVATLFLNDRGDYDPDATDYAQFDLVKFQDGAYYRKNNDPVLINGSNGGGALPTDTNEWVFLVQGVSGSGLASDRISLTGSVSLLETAAEVILYQPTVDGANVQLPPVAPNGFKQFILINQDLTNSINILDENTVVTDAIGGNSGYSYVMAFWIVDEWVLFFKV